MSWFFSKKKASPSTPPEPSTTAANMPNSDADDFIFIERKGNQDPNLDMGGQQGPAPLYPPILPYSLGATGVPESRREQNHLNRQDSMATGYNSMLQGIPFKIAPHLDTDTNNHLREYTESLNDVLFQLSQIDMKECGYDFAVENSVLKEVGGDFD